MYCVLEQPHHNFVAESDASYQELSSQLNRTRENMDYLWCSYVWDMLALQMYIIIPMQNRFSAIHYGLRKDMNLLSVCTGNSFVNSSLHTCNL